MLKINYNTNIYRFKEIVQDYLFDNNKNLPLEHIHLLHDTQGKKLGDREVFTREKDQSTEIHKKFYELSRTDSFTKLYDSFILNIVKPIYNESIVYQSIPTFRIHMPNNIAVGEFHKDKNYRDVTWAESVREDNFFLPFTNAFDTNTVWAESVEDKGDFSPITCDYGQIVQWDGSNLNHGNKINTTRVTRVSVDFRVIRYSNYKPSDHGSINAKSKFQIGGYYKLLQ